MIFQIIIGMTFAVGVYFLLANRFRLPYYKTSKAIVSLSKRQKEKTSGLDVWLKGISSWIAQHLRINDFKREQLLADLQTAQMNISPEEYKLDYFARVPGARQNTVAAVDTALQQRGGLFTDPPPKTQIVHGLVRIRNAQRMRPLSCIALNEFRHGVRANPLLHGRGHPLQSLRSVRKWFIRHSTVPLLPQ